MKSKILFLMLSLVMIVVVIGCNPVDQTINDGEKLIDDVNKQLEEQKEAENKMMMESVVTDEQKMAMTDNLKVLIASSQYDYVGTLKDVTGGNSQGTAKAVFVDGKYLLKVDLKFLPELQGTDFYEGWIVRKGVFFDVISTGKAIKAGDNEYINNYISEQDLTDHTFYVLTLEPDDGNPAPADHVLEGTLETVIG
jgi:hypothetical protein